MTHMYVHFVYESDNITVYTAWRKCMRVLVCLPNSTHNYIIAHLDYNIMERLDRILFYYYL